MKSGNSPHGDPAEGSGGSGYGAFGGTDDRNIGTGTHLNTTTEAGGAGTARPAAGTDDDRAPHRLGVAARGLPAYAQGRRGGSGRRDGGTVRGGPGGEPVELARTVQVGSVSSAAGASGTHPEAGQGGEDETAGHPDAGGQGLAARGADGAGADLRAGLCGLFVRVPARTRRAPGAGGAVGRADVAGRWLGDRFGHPELLRRGGSGPSKGLSGPTGARRSDPTRDRQVVEGRGHGGRRGALPRAGYAARRGDLAAAEQSLPAPCSGPVVRA